MNEFELIARYFKRAQSQHPRLVLGVGDDGALLQPAAGMQLVVSTDTLVSGVHFFADVAPAHLGHKALAVNLSDMAAMGAQPIAFTLALTLPQIDEPWLAEFARGLWALADAHGCALIGGDTTRGPLAISITVLGELPAGAALLRSGAKAGEGIYVSGTATDCIGQARAGLELAQGHTRMAPLDMADAAHAAARLELPSPRVALGLALRGLASSCLDLSDGLVGDLQHILQASQVGAVLDLAALQQLAQQRPVLCNLNAQAQERCMLSGGDDYELLFTAPDQAVAALREAAAASGTVLTCIGRTQAALALQCKGADGQLLALPDYKAWQHFD